MKEFKLLILCLFSVVNIYGQSMEKVKIEHVGEVDKPFPVIELYLVDTNTQSSIAGELIAIADSNVFQNTIGYFGSNIMGEVKSSNGEYGTFLVSFYADGVLKKNVFLSKEGAIYFFVNLHTFLSSPHEDNRVLISGIVRRLL